MRSRWRARAVRITVQPTARTQTAASTHIYSDPRRPAPGMPAQAMVAGLTKAPSADSKLFELALGLSLFKAHVPEQDRRRQSSSSRPWQRPAHPGLLANDSMDRHRARQATGEEDLAERQAFC